MTEEKNWKRDYESYNRAPHPRYYARMNILIGFGSRIVCIAHNPHSVNLWLGFDEYTGLPIGNERTNLLIHTVAVGWRLTHSSQVNGELKPAWNLNVNSSKREKEDISTIRYLSLQSIALCVRLTGTT